MEENWRVQDGNEVILTEFEKKKVQLDYSKAQTSRGTKNSSSKVITLANVDWSGFPGAAHSLSRNKHHRRREKNTPMTSTSVKEKQEQTRIKNGSNVRKEKLHISPECSPKKGVSPNRTKVVSPNVPSRKLTDSRRKQSRRIASRRNLLSEATPSISETRNDHSQDCEREHKISSGQNNPSDDLTRRRSTKSRGQEDQNRRNSLSKQNHYSRRSQRHLLSMDSNNDGLLTSSLHSMPRSVRESRSIAKVSGHGMSVSSRNLGISTRKSPSKSRRKIDDVIVSHLKKQSSMRW